MEGEIVNSYEEKQERRKARYEELAEKAEARSNAAFDGAREAVAGIPLGQPILVDHYSARRHRAALKRQDQRMRKGLEESKKAEHYRGKAAGMAYAGISADDPEALEKLEDKVESAERLREVLKAVNAAWRKAGRPKQGSVAFLDWVKSLDEHDQKSVAFVIKRYSWPEIYPEPVPSYALSNMGANIRRMKKRAESIDAEADRPEVEPITGDGWTCFEDRDENRVCFKFDARTSKETYKILRRWGFVWSRTNDRFQRKLNTSGRSAAEAVGDHLERGGWK